MPKDRFAGKVALVTGGTSGLGRAIAEGFAADGAIVFFIGRNESAGREIENSIKDAGGDATFVKCDVSIPAEIEAAVRKAEERTGHVDMLVNNAGIGSEGSIVSIDLDEWQKALDVNLLAPFYFMRFAIPKMKESGKGSIINISSLAAKVTIPEAVGYCTTKAGLVHMSKQAALDFGPEIRVNAVLPGLFETNINAGAYQSLSKELNVSVDELLADSYEYTPMKKPAKPPQIYGLVSFLASDDASYVTGDEIVIDGGLLVVDPYSVGMEKSKIRFGS